MRLFLIGTLLLSGGGAVAMQNDVVQDKVEGIGHNVRYVMERRAQHGMLDRIKEDGLPYPPQTYLDTLTDEQEAIIMTTIDQINVEYDWANMTDQELIETLQIVREELGALYDELGLEQPHVGEYLRRRVRHQMRNRVIDNLSENGLPYPSEAYLDTLTEEQQTAIIAQIDAYNNTYDWANMTEEEVVDALQLIRVEMRDLKTELGIEAPYFEHHRRHRYNDEDDTVIPE